MVDKNNIKHILISILIGAAVAFFSTLFQGIADLLKAHATDIISGSATSFAYLAKKFTIT